jgi:hypothetical protein
LKEEYEGKVEEMMKKRRRRRNLSNVMESNKSKTSEEKIY